MGFERLQESKGTLCAEESGKEEDNSVICVSLHPVSALQWGKRQEAAHYKINLKFYKRVLPQREVECQTDFFLKKKKKMRGGGESNGSKINLRRSVLYGDVSGPLLFASVP